MIETMLLDLRRALLGLARSPATAGLATLTLALGIGAHVAIFSLLNAVFLQPLPFPQADRLVGVYESRDGAGFFPLSLPDYADHREATTVFSSLAAHYPNAPLSLETAEGLEEINGSVVSANYFSLLGVEPARGRFFQPEEDTGAGAYPVVVVSYSLWQSRLGAREDVLGTLVNLNGTALTVVGVAPEGFQGVELGFPSDVWLPMAMSSVGYRWCDTASRDCTWLTMIGRLQPGATIAEARAEMEVLGRRTRETHPLGGDTVRGLSVAPLLGVHPAVRHERLRLAALLLAAVTLLLMTAGANVSALLVARGLSRRKEIAVRLAIGGTRRRVVSLFLAEGWLLTAAGGAAGLLVATWLQPLVALFYPSAVPLDLGVDPTVVGYSALLCLATGALVGLVPGLQAARPSVLPALKDEVTMGSRRRPRLLGALVIFQVALSFVLVTSTGLLVRSLIGAGRERSVDPASVATLRLRPRLVGFGPPEAQALNREVVRRLAALPGVESVSLSSGLPPFLFFNPVHVTLAAEASGGEGRGRAAWTDQIGPRLFETLGIPLVEGRDFDEHDTAGSAPVAIVNRTLATELWPDDEAVGQRLVIEDRTVAVVGVAEDAAILDESQTSVPRVFTSYWQSPSLVDARVAVRTTGDAAALLPTLRREIRSIDPDVPVTEVGTMLGRLEAFLAPVHLAGRVVGMSGGIAVFLSAVGLYGVLALAVAQRRRDIGIRMALGGSRSHVVALVVRDAMTLVGIALGLGLLAALAASQSLAHYLYGVSPRDLHTFVAAAWALALVSGLASWWPARRAAQVEPSIALGRR